MPEPKYLWRVLIAPVPKAMYLVAQNAQSAAAQATSHAQVLPTDLRNLQRIDPWDDQQNMTVVHWPQPPPQPDPEPEPEP